MDSPQLLLLSTSTIFGSSYLDYAEQQIRDFFANLERVLFVPFALQNQEDYASRAAQRFARMGFELVSLHQAADMRRSVEAADAMFVGGGNTFRLLNALYDHDLSDVIRNRVADGMRYMGSSAGSNIAAPTIRTTNDMPIVEPPTFDALNLVPFQINPHYLDPDPASTHMGETREERLQQYLEENEAPVIGLREGAMIRIDGSSAELEGPNGGRLFRRNQEPVELAQGADLSSLLG